MSVSVLVLLSAHFERLSGLLYAGLFLCIMYFHLPRIYLVNYECSSGNDMLRGKMASHKGHVSESKYTKSLKHSIYFREAKHRVVY